MRDHLGAHELIAMEQALDDPDESQPKRTTRVALSQEVQDKRACYFGAVPQLMGDRWVTDG